MNGGSSISPPITNRSGMPAHQVTENASQPPYRGTPSVTDYSETEPEQMLPGQQRTVALQIREALSSAQAGLTVYSLEDADHQYFAMKAVVTHMLGGQVIETLPAPAASAEVTHLFNGSDKDFKLTKVLTDPGGDPGRSAYKVVRCSPLASFDWTADGCAYLLDRHIEGGLGGTVIIAQRHTGGDASALVAGLRLLDKIAQENEVPVALFLSDSGDCHRKVRLSEHCSGFVRVQHCEPDVGQDLAFAFDGGDHHQLGRLGPRKTMCSVKFDKDQIIYSFDPFISPQLDDRIIWMMRARRKTLEEIARALRKHKTTILRRLQCICGPDMRDVDEAWVEAKLAAFSEVGLLE